MNFTKTNCGHNICPSRNKAKASIKIAAAITSTIAAMLLSGCAGMSTSSSTNAITTSLAGMHGGVFGGQQPVSNAQVLLYAAGTSSYGSTDPNLLTSAVTTNALGQFTITGLYTCTAGQQMFLVAHGGNPGASNNNPNLTLMAALGDCANLSASTFVQINEVTTVASVFALAPFMSGYSAVGSTTGNTTGLQRAFVSANKLASSVTGGAPGPMLAAGAVAPVSEINSLANSVASCINSAGGTAGDSSPCGQLFSYTTPSGGTAPTDTIGALLNLAQNPSLNAASIYVLAQSAAPFQPSLKTAPTDWSMSINYSAGAFSTPSSTTIDANGNVWVANRGNNTVTTLAQTGTPVSGSPLAGNGLSTPSAIAFDRSGDAWITNQAGNSVSVFTGSGGIYAGSPFSGGGISAPVALAMDAANDVWISNSGNNSITELYTSGTFVQQVTGVATPSAIAINPK